MSRKIIYLLMVAIFFVSCTNDKELAKKVVGTYIFEETDSNVDSTSQSVLLIKHTFDKSGVSTHSGVYKVSYQIDDFEFEASYRFEYEGKWSVKDSVLTDAINTNGFRVVEKNIKSNDKEQEEENKKILDYIMLKVRTIAYYKIFKIHEIDNAVLVVSDRNQNVYKFRRDYSQR